MNGFLHTALEQIESANSKSQVFRNNKKGF